MRIHQWCAFPANAERVTAVLNGDALVPGKRFPGRLLEGKTRALTSFAVELHS